MNVREFGVRLLLCWGIVKASPEDLLLAAQLSVEYQIDISRDLRPLLSKSEVPKLSQD